MKKPLVQLLILSLAVTVLPAFSSFAQAKKAAANSAEKSIFKDHKLEEAVRQYVFDKRNTTKPITAGDVANISVIKAKGKGITDLTGLEHCKRLASLDLSDNQIKDITPIKGLAMIQLLDLSNNQVEDISVLSTISALQYIELTKNHVKDITALAGLTNLASIYLSDNRLTDIRPLFKLPKVASLYADDNQISTIAGINNLKRLSSLSLKKNKLTDVAPLVGLNGLYYLFLEDNQITDLTPLYTMAKKDYEGEREFSPFINLYIKGNPLQSSSQGYLTDLKHFGARVYN